MRPKSSGFYLLYNRGMVLILQKCKKFSIIVQICIENINHEVTEQLDYLTALGYTKTKRFVYNDIYERF